jgi:hypothetical protein
MEAAYSTAHVRVPPRMRGQVSANWELSLADSAPEKIPSPRGSFLFVRPRALDAQALLGLRAKRLLSLC